MHKRTIYNRFDIYITLLIALQFFGIYGGALQPVRVLSLLSFPVLLMCRANLKYYRYEFVFFVFFLISGLALTIFSFYVAEAMKELLYLAISFNMVFNVIIAANNAKRPKNSIIRGWFLFLLFALPIAVFEIFFDWHFSNSKVSAGTFLGGHDRVLKKFAALTFGNFNLFNVVIVYALPFAFSFLLLDKLEKKIKVVLLALLLTGGLVILVNGSRGAFLGAIICVACFFWKSFTKKKRKNLFVLIAVLVMGINYLTTKGSNLLLVFTDKKDRLFSDNARQTLIEISFEELVNSNFLGVGPANIEYIIVNNHGYNLGATHNLFMEILAQYGLPVFLGFIYLLYRIYKRAFKVDKISKYIIITSILIIPITSVINSKYLAGVNFWLFLASLLIISNHKLKKIE
ncbi:O-antigen ligase family protein [Polaribacter pectinis]|uniref:O-antigen ligase family protein n=1 Tax=Polaribacter pectinis TaxID=2738844 RepID=A0A7G9LAX7_9FLAO|nr:O-antigen ligase family protein [Polaribacter pectinis]QNM85776.1 O-antigen ligase family protein [Polaribacter pectinis]